MSEQTTQPQTGHVCPVCRVDLVMSERQSIEVDYCPKCRGVWLDRGELDKIIERSIAPAAVEASRPEAPRGYQDYRGGHGDYGHQGHRRKSWLRDIFD